MAFDRNQSVIYTLVQNYVKSKECVAHLKSYVEKDSDVMKAATEHDWGRLKVNATYGIISSHNNPQRINALFGEIETYLTNNIEAIFPEQINLSRAGIRKLVHYVLIPEAVRYGVAIQTIPYNINAYSIQDIVWYGYDHFMSVIEKCESGSKVRPHKSDSKSTAILDSSNQCIHGKKDNGNVVILNGNRCLACSCLYDGFDCGIRVKSYGCKLFPTGKARMVLLLLLLIRIPFWPTLCLALVRMCCKKLNKGMKLK